MFSLPFFTLFAFISTCGFSATSAPNSLSGRHLRVIWPRWSGNPKGLSGPLKGGVVLDYLSNRLNFTYEMVRVTENRLEPPTNGRGLFSYLFDQQCDLLLQDVMPTFQRNQIVDMTLPWIYDYLAFLIPVANETANIYAITKPFQWPVWLGLCLSIVFVISILNLMRRFSTNLTANRDKTEQSINENVADNLRVAKQQTGNYYLYVFGNLLAQGGTCKSKHLPFRLVAGVWTLSAFILVQAYTSILFTYIMMPVNQPLINSIYDVAESPDMNLLVKKAGTMDIFVSFNSQKLNNTSNMYVKLQQRLDSSPNFRCTLVSDCISLVTPGSRNVFMDAVSYLKDAIRADFARTGKCNLQIAKERFISTSAAVALPKNSLYTKSINQGLLELRQTGMIDHWDSWFRPMPPQCNGKKQMGDLKTAGNKQQPLTLKNLTGAFIVLSLGLTLSLLAFLCEKILLDRKKTPACACEAKQSIC